MSSEAAGGLTIGLLARLRRAAGITQEELAERTGLSVRAISNIERGRVTRVRRDSFELLVDALDLSAPARAELAASYRSLSPADTGTEPTAGRHGPAELPRSSRTFVGRTAELARLDILLTERASDTTTIVTIDGMAGIGKTALALHWGQRARAQFPDGQLYANLGGFGAEPAAAPRLILGNLLRSLDVPAGRVPDEVEARSALLRSELAERDVLLVLDNAHSARQVRALLPGAGRAFTIVTGRSYFRGLVSRDGAFRIALPLLAMQECSQLIRQVAGPAIPSRDSSAVRAVIGYCAGLPLALTIAGERAAHGEGAIRDLDQLLSDRTHRLQRLSEDEDDNIREIMSWSYSKLGGAAGRTFRLLGLHPGRDFDVTAVGALTGLAPDEAATAVDQLVGASLLQTPRPGRYDLHDLLQQFAADVVMRPPETGRSRREALDRLLSNTIAIATEANAAISPGTHPGSMSEADALQWFATERRNFTSLSQAAMNVGAYSAVVALARSVARYLRVNAWSDDALAVQQDALVAARHVDAVSAEAWALREIGSLHAQIGRTGDAVREMEASLVLFRTIKDHWAQSEALDDLGRILVSTGEFDAAIPHLEHAVVLADDAENGEIRGSARVNLGLALTRLGRLDEAVQVFRSAVPIARRIRDKSTEGAALNNLGLVSRRTGRLDEALQSFERAASIAVRIGHREGEAIAMTNIGTVLKHMGRPAEAMRFHRDALECAKRAGLSSLEPVVLNRIGETALACAEVDAATRHHRSALDLAERGGLRLEVARAHQGLGDALAASNDIALSVLRWRAAAEIYDELGVPDGAHLRARMAAAAGAEHC